MSSSARSSGGSRLALVALAVVASALPLLSGCAEEEAEGRQAAYPEPIGYTPPPAEARAAAAPAAPPAVEEGAEPEEAPPPPGDSRDVVIGADDPEAAAAAPSAPYAPPAPYDDAAQAPPPGEYADTDPSALTDFRGALEPYGTWTDDPTYGTVWVPSPGAVGPGFTPYVTAGHWVYDDDYTWVSDYSWGWAPFHYGRWAWVDGVGWEWIPGRVYAGAWVSWRYGWGDWGYVGWAPLAPTWCWRHGYAVGLGFVPAASYAYVGSRELFSPVVGTRVVTGTQVGVIGAHTQPYVPGASGRVAANPTVAGPPPRTLGIPSSVIVRGGSTDRGVAQARAFARPSTAISMGAHAPRVVASRAATPGVLRGVEPGGRLPAYGAAAPPPSHFGGRLGAGFSGGGVANAPGYGRSYSASTARPYYSAPAVAPRAAPAMPAYRGYSTGYGASPAYRGAPGAPVYRAAPPSSGGGHPSVGYSGGGFHGGGFSGGGFRGGGFHASGGGGVSRGGGGRR